MLLHDLFRRFDPALSLSHVPNIEVAGVSEDSRTAGAGFVFVARPGEKVDGRSFIPQARRNGAILAVVSERVGQCPLPQVVTADIQGAGARLTNLLLDEPSKKIDVIGVTGTNGKTTVTYLVRHILASVRRRCGLIGTVEIDDGRSTRESEMTTPDGVLVAQALGAMRDNGAGYCAMEVSSHALDQRRVAGVRFVAAAFTNLTGDHLDYHGDMPNYAAAKAKLFESLDAGAVAVTNAHDEWSQRMLQDCKARRQVSFGIDIDADYRASAVDVSMDGSRFKLSTPDGTAPVSLPMIGRHNIANALTAAALVGELYKLPVQQIAAALNTAGGAPGRLQAVRCGQEFGVFVDYAHTDDGLRNVLEALRPLTRGRLRVVFGCGGDRDTSKRSRMAKVVEELGDVAYLTSDNPRTENPLTIIEMALKGFSERLKVLRSGHCPAPGDEKMAIVEVDRRLAIERAISDARPGDVVLLAGKGHENYQIVGKERRHFDDVEEARRALGAAPAAA